MKVAYSQTNVTASEGVQTTGSFNIARTPHMFNILSSGLYSDKIAAVLREISCNAMDAHIMGGVPDKPFQVKLPTPLDRSFYVKDWGPGLDDREVRELYTTYGWSSKQNTDDVTGAFGLGSKSPFAYTTQSEEDSDGFTIVAVKDGIKRIYTCHIGEEGAPAISRLHEGPADADWPHGVMVTFPVQSRDITEFHQKAVEIFRWFRIQPEVLGLDRTLQKPDFEFTGSFFSMKPKDQSVDRGACVVTGNVRYPVNASRLGALSKTESALLQSGVHLFLPIGQVMMTPSREELQYTEATKANLKKHLAAAALEVAKRVREDVMTPEPTMWEWYKKIQTYHDTLPYGVQNNLDEFLKEAGLPDEEVKLVIRTVRERTAEVPRWVGDGIAGPTPVYQRDATGVIVRDASGEPVRAANSPVHGARVWLYSYDKSREVVRRREILNGKIRSGSEYVAVNLSFLSDVRVYHADAKLADQRVRGVMRRQECEHAMLVVPCRGTPQTFAQTYGERLVGKDGLDGLKLYGVSTLEIPGEVELDRERRRLAREQGPRALFADHEVQYLGLNGNVTTTTIGELDETEMFYMTATRLDNLRRGSIRNKTESYEHSFQGYYVETVMQAVNTIVKDLKLPVGGVVLVASEGAARRLKLAEQGFKPFLPYFTEELAKNRTRWTDLVASIDRTPKVDLREMWRADDYGWLGILGFHAKQQTPFWKRFEAEFFASPVTHAVLEFVKNSSSEKADETNTGSVLPALQALQHHMYNHGLPELSVDRLSHYEVRKVFNEMAPSFEGLQEQRLIAWMQDNVERALSFLRLALTSDGLLDESSGRRLKLAA